MVYAPVRSIIPSLKLGDYLSVQAHKPCSLTCFTWPYILCKSGISFFSFTCRCTNDTKGWSGGAMVLGKLPVPGRPTIWITVGQGPTALAVGAGGGCLDIFSLIYPFFPLSPSLWETARYRLKYCLKGPLNPKSTNQPTNDTKKLCHDLQFNSVYD